MMSVYILFVEFTTLDILINNAGVMFCPFSKTEDGNELHFQTNYLCEL